MKLKYKVIILILIQITYFYQLCLTDKYQDNQKLITISKIPALSYQQIILIDIDKFSKITDVTMTPDANSTLLY